MILKKIMAWFKRPGRKELESTIEYLWQIIDDIDTAGDMAKSNDKAYREIVERKQRLRWKTGITTDGYDLDMSGIKCVDTTGILWL